MYKLLLSIVYKKLFFQFRKFPDLFVLIQSGNVTLTYQWGEMVPSYILLYKFLVTHPDFMKSWFGDFSQNLSGTNILEFFSKFELVLAVSVLFHEQLLFFVYIFCWNNEYILLTLLVVFESRAFRKNLDSFFRDIFNNGK